MKRLKNILWIALIGISLTSCYEEEFFVDDNATSDGRHFPVIQLVSVDGNIAEGSSVNVIVQYWSVDAVKELELNATENGTESLYSTTPYAYSYDADASAEIMNLSYSIPTGTTGTTIDFRVVVVAENGLTREMSTSIDVP